MKNNLIIFFLIVIIFIVIIFYSVFSVLDKKYNIVEQNLYFNGDSSNIVESNNYSEEDYVMRTVDNVTMTIKEETLTNSSATIVILDKNKPSFIYGDWYRIDKKISDRWKELKPRNENYIFNAIGYSLENNDTLELKIDWIDLYGKLKRGQYRLVKKIGNEYIATEFNID